MKQSEMIAALLEVVRRQQDTLDRIVGAQYDRPIVRTVHPIVSDQMPQWGLNDQGDSAQPDPIASGIGNLHVDSDEAFLNSIQ